ncbi:hypothetical protein RHSP_83271 (plasmid) [Rhizobium freirei PRF 81]|uniref:Uncharacterized protein n=1 Tax=Rhizobium freirei PRF 81 TaxID=363754 RepID=N6UXL8_9HYPH|nr:hypothetical protein RHSP_83271 [Rhizobium freirei PRF 81]
MLSHRLAHRAQPYKGHARCVECRWHFFLRTRASNETRLPSERIKKIIRQSVNRNFKFLALRSSGGIQVRPWQPGRYGICRPPPPTARCDSGLRSQYP